MGNCCSQLLALTGLLVVFRLRIGINPLLYAIAVNIAASMNISQPYTHFYMHIGLGRIASIFTIPKGAKEEPPLHMP